MGVFAAMIWGSTVGFEADQCNPDTKYLFTFIAEKNQSPE